jgi:uncharacterized protein YegP (UPF0339 family)
MATRTYPSYWVYRDTRNEYRWTYEAANGETIGVSSEGYKRKADCMHSIKLMKQSANSEVWMPQELLNAA